MSEEELDKFTRGRKIFDSLKLVEWTIDGVNNVFDLILLSNDQRRSGEMTTTYFYEHCFFSDELFATGETRSVKKCECGVDKLGYGLHSDYCPKHAKEKV